MEDTKSLECNSCKSLQKWEVSNRQLYQTQHFKMPKEPYKNLPRAILLLIITLNNVEGNCRGQKEQFLQQPS